MKGQTQQAEINTLITEVIKHKSAVLYSPTATPHETKICYKWNKRLGSAVKINHTNISSASLF